MEDVVAQHHQRNRPPRLPDSEELLTIRRQQVSQRSCSIGHTTSAADRVDEVETPVSQGPRAAVSPTDVHSSSRPLPQPVIGSVASGVHPDNADPSQLNFYPPAFRDIIERAKQFSHCDLASINSFPLCPQFNTKAEEYMNEAIVERRSRGLVIPEGEYYFHSVQWETDHHSFRVVASVCERNHQARAYQHEPLACFLLLISSQLWEDIGNWQSSLKKKARNFVREQYRWDPQNRHSVNADTAKTLLERGAFLKDGRDEEVSRTSRFY